MISFALYILLVPLYSLSYSTNSYSTIFYHAMQIMSRYNLSQLSEASYSQPSSTTVSEPSSEDEDNELMVRK